MNQVGSQSNLVFTGSFTFSDNQKFRAIIDLAEKAEVTSITIDLTHVDFIDSAGLGMLLLLRDVCTKKQSSITLQHPTGQVAKIFNISKFEQLFRIVN